MRTDLDSKDKLISFSIYTVYLTILCIGKSIIKFNAFKNTYVFEHYIIILKDKFHIVELCRMKHKHNLTYLCLLQVMPVVVIIYFVIAALWK